MGSVTANFQSESPLHPAARAFLTDAFDRGWADPAKPHQASRQAAILLNESKEIFANHLGIRPDQVQFLADPSLGFHLGIAGLANERSRMYYSAVDRSEVFAEADALSATKLAVGINGLATYPDGTPDDVLAWQSANGETGIINFRPDNFQGRIFVDATSSGAQVGLPPRWSTVLWNSRAWEGPAGLGVFAIFDRSEWRNPLPHNDQIISGSTFSLPLAMASALALEAYTAKYKEERRRLEQLNMWIRGFLQSEIHDVDIAGDASYGLTHLLSFSILYVDAQQLVTELDRRGFAVDSGSACNSANVEPSHVLAAMGLLTHGNVRLTLHSNTSDEQIEAFLQTLKELILEIRE